MYDGSYEVFATPQGHLMQYFPHPHSPNLCRLTAFAAVSVLFAADAIVANDETIAPLMAYVGTFSSPLKDTLPTQVDLPPGNGGPPKFPSSAKARKWSAESLEMR